jgi:hypothetical protein
MMISIDLYILIAILFGSTMIGAIIASVATMRYLHSINALDVDAINKHRKEASKRAGEKLRHPRKH